MNEMLEILELSNTSRPDATPLRISIDGEGRLRMIWDDRLADLIEEMGRQGHRAAIRRASRVEPGFGEDPLSGYGWIANLSPVGGPCLGPFRLRGEALDAERRWIEQKLLSGSEERTS